MGLKKTWFGYLNGVLGVLGTGYLLFNLLFEIFKELSFSQGSFSFFSSEDAMRACFTAVLMLAFSLLIMGISLIKNRVEAYDFSEGRFIKVFSTVVLVLFVCYFVVNRYMICVQDFTGAYSETELAKINTAFLGDSFKINSLSDFYYFFIGLFYRFFGENLIIIPVFNSILEFLSLIFIYNSFAGLLGYIPALFMSTLPFFIYDAFFDPFKINRNLLFITLGAFILLIVSNVLYAYGLEGKEDEANYKKTSFMITTVLVLLFFTFLNYIILFIADYRATFNLSSFSCNFMTDYLDKLILLALLSLSMAGFISSFFEREDYISTYTLPLIIAGLASCLGLYKVYSYALFTFMICLSAGSGLRSILFKGFKPVILDFAEISENTKKAETITETEKQKEEPVLEEIIINKPAEKEPALAEIPVNISLKEDMKAEEPVKAESLPKKPELIENPLKEPKPHVKKSMAYGFEPDEAQMKYDVEISDTDDFDI